MKTKSLSIHNDWKLTLFNIIGFHWSLSKLDSKYFITFKITWLLDALKWLYGPLILFCPPQESNSSNYCVVIIITGYLIPPATLADISLCSTFNIKVVKNRLKLQILHISGNRLRYILDSAAKKSQLNH